MQFTIPKATHAQHDRPPNKLIGKKNTSQNFLFVEKRRKKTHK